MTYGLTVAPAKRTVADRKRLVTRDAVLDAVLEVFKDRGLEFSVQEVADRAGLAHRTVYRHFPNRDALIDGLAARFEASLAKRGFSEGATLDEVVEKTGPRFAWFEAEADLVHAVAIKTIATGQRTAPSVRRGERIRALFRERYSNLPVEEADAAFVAARTLIGVVGWHHMTSDGISSPVAARIVQRMVEAALADLERRDTEAARAATGRQP